VQGPSARPYAPGHGNLPHGKGGVPPGQAKKDDKEHKDKGDKDKVDRPHGPRPVIPRDVRRHRED
jgi:hypothetical protein